MNPLTPRAAAVAAFTLTLAGTAGAQGLMFDKSALEPLAPRVENWGGSSDVIVTYDASDFEVFSGTAGGTDPNTAARFCGGVPCGWLVGIQLPAGASMRSVELDACDTDGANEVAIAVFRSAKGGGTVTFLAPPAGTGATPGCGTFVLTLTTPETINNLANSYVIDVLSGPSLATRFRAVRVLYRLQVSPAPATASFTDVPTSHFAFRFVEALAASGITGGCGGGNYCPDAPLTRAQMAIFLSAALGLHFPN